MDNKLSDPMEEFEDPSSIEAAVVTSHGVSFANSQREGKIALFDSYMYVKNHVMKTGRIYYNCREKTSGCKGSLTLEGSGEVYETATHNHMADPCKVRAEISEAEFRDRAKRSHTRTRKLHSEVVQKIEWRKLGLAMRRTGDYRDRCLAVLFHYTINIK